MPAAAPARLAEDTAADAIAKGWDWHNDMSVFNLDLRRRLQSLGSDKARLKMIRELQKVIGGK